MPEILAVPGSPPGTINSNDLRRLGKSLLISVVGCVGAWGLQAVVPVLSQSGASGAFVASLSAFLFNAAVVWATDTAKTVIVALPDQLPKPPPVTIASR